VNLFVVRTIRSTYCSLLCVEMLIFALYDVFAINVNVNLNLIFMDPCIVVRLNSNNQQDATC